MRKFPPIKKIIPILIPIAFAITMILAANFVFTYQGKPIQEFKGEFVAHQFEWGLGTIISTTWYFQDGTSLTVDDEMRLIIGETYEIKYREGSSIDGKIELISLRKIS